MALSRGTTVKNVNNTDPCTTVVGTVTLTAGRSYIVVGLGFGTAARTLTCASDLDGSLGTADISTGSSTLPHYVWHKNSATGGSTAITVTASGNMHNLVILVVEVAGGALTLKASRSDSFSATTNWNGTEVDTTATTGMLFATGYVTNRVDGTLTDFANDGQGNNYNSAVLNQTTTSGESGWCTDLYSSQAQANRGCNATMSTNDSGTMHFVAYAGGSTAYTISADSLSYALALTDITLTNQAIAFGDPLAVAVALSDITLGINTAPAEGGIINIQKLTDITRIRG